MGEKRKDCKGRMLKVGEYYDVKNKRYMFRKMINNERFTLTANDLPELRRQENELLHMIDKGQRIKTQSSKITLDEYFEHWMNLYAKSGRKATTCTNYKSYYNSYIYEKDLGKKQIRKISKADCQAVINKMIQEGLSHSTMANLKSCLNNIFECAIDDDILVKNPMKNIKLPHTKKRKIDAIDLEQVSKFMDFVKNNNKYSYYYPLFATLFNSGTRIGELAALTWKDIDFEKNYVTVDKTVNRYRKKDYGFTMGIASVKSETSIRTFAMNGFIKAILLRLKLQRPQQTPVLPFVDDAGNIRGSIDGFVFLNSYGNVWSEPAFNALIKRIIAAYNKEAELHGEELLKDFCPHQSRHTYTSAAYEAGVDMKAVSQMLGHASENITLNVYTHLSKEKQKEQEEIAKAINIS